MNKTDRLLAILIELQRNSVTRAEDLAERFETSVRTIYRDMQSLSEAGIPIASMPGIGYSLMEGYFLPPVSFTVEEAVALLIGADFVENAFDANYGAQAVSSRSKIEAILPEQVRSETNRVRTSIRLLADHRSRMHRGEKAYFQTLHQAILGRRKVKIHYSKNTSHADDNRHSIRTIAPYGLVFAYGSWVLIANCELRGDIRHFRLSRMTDLMILEDTFPFPANFHLQDYKPADDRHVIVRIQVRPEIADRVKESQHFYMESVEENEQGLLVTCRVRQPEELLLWLLGWGAGVVVLEPLSLRNQMREEVEKMLKHY
ncbi:helix-turn-helix transcriptional regulator [Paenibacillus sp. KN14-4R]|uniref:helix-turn-helix transcriptional regulator n=1 Tax=Paenibacillus sp. KN14-4R TaxID=3445773 RepID=UPI003FA0DFB6